VHSLNPAWVRVASAFCATRRELLFRIMLPASVGSVLASLRIGGGLALIGLFVAETYGVNRGVGYQTIVGAKRMDVTGVLAGLALLALLGLGLEQTLRTAERWLAPWRSSL
jgi:NitT/TauT family transport system permease protein